MSVHIEVGPSVLSVAAGNLRCSVAVAERPAAAGAGYAEVEGAVAGRHAVTTALAGASPHQLAPGDPDGARALAERLESYAEGAGAATARLRALESGAWVGEAADAFRSSLDQLPQRLRRASAAFAEAASALRAYAAAAEEARERAALALARFDDALAATARWEYQRADHDAAVAAEASGGPPAGPGPSGHDPGADARRAAEGLAEELGADLEAAERAVEQRLRQAAADAPTSPGSGTRPFASARSSWVGQWRPRSTWASSPSSSAPPTP